MNFFDGEILAFDKPYGTTSFKVVYTVRNTLTVRGKKAEELLKLGLKVKDNELKAGCFSSTGNFGFGIQEHIDLGIKYDPNTGIYGMDFFTVLARKGKRVAQRKRQHARLGNFQKVSKEEAQKWFTEKLGGTLI